MPYEINVSKNGKHYFATAPRSLDSVTRDDAQTMARQFVALFPAADGYKVTLTEMHTSGRTLEIDTPYDERGRPIKCSCCGTTKGVRPDVGSGGPYRCGSPSCMVF